MENLWTIRTPVRPARAGWTFRGWYRKHDGCWSGPVPAGEIARLLRSRELLPSERLMAVWKDGDRTRYAYRTAELAARRRHPAP
jgi:hypothetical protein